MDDEVAKLRSESQRCRRLADSMTLGTVRDMLNRMADEFDEAAEELEAKQRAGRRNEA
jgi:hypothetical protein